jgi:AcrR family transcriptional regulator
MGISQENSGLKDAAKGVPDRLLDAAEQLFSEHGFEGTSIRDLAAAAGCNIASVNYYFGGKENLYMQLWRRHLLHMRDTRVASIDKVMAQSGGKPRLEDLLRSFAYGFISPLMDDASGRRLIRLMAREMVDPHLPSDTLGKEVIESTLTAMQQALAKACPELDGSKVPLVVFSLVGQLLHTIRIKAMFQWIDGRTMAVFEPAKVIEHVVSFTAAGIRAYAEGRN